MRKKTILKVGETLYHLALKESFGRNDITLINRHNFMSVLIKTGVAEKLKHGSYRIVVTPNDETIKNLAKIYGLTNSIYQLKSQMNGK